MQIKYFLLVISSLVVLLQPNNTFAQTITVNEDGKKIVVYPDGSWHFYKEPAADSTTLTIPAHNETLEKDDASKVKKSNKSRASKGKSKSGKSQKSKNNEQTDALLESEERQKAIERAERAAALEERARLRAEEVTFSRIFLEEKVEDSYHDINLTHEDITAIEKRLKETKAEEVKAKDDLEKAREQSAIYERMIDMPAVKRKKLLAKMGEEMEVSKSDVAIIPQPEMEQKENFQQETYEAAKETTRPPVRAYDPKSNLLLFPPKKPCDLAFDDIDQFSGKKRKQTQKTLFFTHTPERFQSYFKGRDYMQCYGTLVSVDGTPRFLNMEFVIATDQAAREFGILEKGSQFILRFIDGQRLILLNNKTITGIADPVSKTTTYSISYPLDKGQIKTLLSAEVDVVRMIWATGYEDYELYLVDFFRDLFLCLDEG
jgi:hypothetical protein